MKFLVVFCFIISAAVFANAAPTATFDIFDFDADFESDAEAFGINSTVECIKNGITNVINENPALGSLINEIQQTVNGLIEKGKKCNSLSGIKQRLCQVKLVIVAEIELERILESVTDEHKQALDQLKNVVVDCIQN